MHRARTPRAVPGDRRRVLQEGTMKRTILTTALTGVLLVGAAVPAMAGHEHLIKITNPATGEVTCQYIARGATPTNDNFHDHAHTGPGKIHRGNVAFIEKEGNVVAGAHAGAPPQDLCDTERGRQSEVIDPH